VAALVQAARPRPPAILLALLVDRAVGEPAAIVHPVVLVGKAIALLERRAPTGAGPAFVYGTSTTLLVVGATAAVGVGLRSIVGALPDPLGLAAEAWLLKTTFSVRALLDASAEVEQRLRLDDLAGARLALRALVSRETTSLDDHDVTSAAIESLAENTVDSIVAPLLAYALGGLPAAFAYRSINTLDAMIGYRDAYEHLGKAAARLDDLVNLLPARLAAGLLLLGGVLAGGHVATGIDRLLRHRQRTASPNAGWPMSVMAGLLGVRLEKRGQYVLGDPSPRPDVAAIDHAAEIVSRSTLLTAGLTCGLAWLRGRCTGLPSPHSPGAAPPPAHG